MEPEYGKIDLKSEASKLCESDECERLFARARDRFPGYNDEQALDALDLITQGLESAFADGYADDQWHSIAEHLADHLQNGLT
jgi:hypothetical protein